MDGKRKQSLVVDVERHSSKVDSGFNRTEDVLIPCQTKKKRKPASWDFESVPSTTTKDLFSWPTILGDFVWSDEMALGDKPDGNQVQVEQGDALAKKGWMLKETICACDPPVVFFHGPFSSIKAIQVWIEGRFEQTKKQVQDMLELHMGVKGQQVHFRHVVYSKTQVHGFQWRLGTKNSYFTHVYMY